MQCPSQRSCGIELLVSDGEWCHGSIAAHPSSAERTFTLRLECVGLLKSSNFLQSSWAHRMFIDDESYLGRAT